MVDIEEFLRQRKEEGLLRSLRRITRRKAGRICIDNKEYIDFSSNDYLGLSGHPKLIEAAQKAMETYGAAACASRLMSGSLGLHHKLEEKIAQFKNKEAALVFNSGYQANVGIISSLYDKGDCVFSDRLNHASIIDGIILSQAKFFRFQHNDVEHLKLLLERERRKFKGALVVTESIFSMDGDRPPLKELVRLKEEYGCQIMVDEAHATGIFGPSGAGIAEEEGLSARIDLVMGTFSKALAGFGAYLASSKAVKEYLINTCRSFIYSTALPPAVIAGNIASLELVTDEPMRRRALLDNAEYFRQALETKGFDIRGSSQIAPLVVGDNLKTKKFAEILQEKGYWVLPIRPPTVPKGEARLRFSLTFHHNRKILERLINDIAGIKI